MSATKEKLHEEIEHGMRKQSFLNTCSYWILKIFLFLIPPYPSKKHK
jgi:hypothetical protein